MMSTRQRVVMSMLLLGIGSAPLAHAEAPGAEALPDFMEHWEFGWNIDEDDGPSYFADPILPLYRNRDATRVIFLEPRVTFTNSQWLTNMGVGYRQLIRGGEWMVGTNLFHDYTSRHSHYRVGAGVEAVSSYAEFRSNAYIGFSQARLIVEKNFNETFEEVVDGFDVEMGMPVPYYSRLKVFYGFNWYNYEQFKAKDRYGWTLRTEYKPVPFVVIDGLVSDDTKGNVDWGMTLAVKLPLGQNLPDELRSPFELDPTMFPESDASDQLWILVERHHEIVLEKYQVSGGASVEILRGT